jgi:SRSO17 transposase
VVRRSIEEPDELTAYTVFAPEGTSLEALARTAGSRWRGEIGFEEAKGEVGRSHYEVRSWHGWYRHVTLSLFAHAFLAAIRAEGIDRRHHYGGLWRKCPGPFSSCLIHPPS